jgi:hypothetical protein
VTPQKSRRPPPRSGAPAADGRKAPPAKANPKLADQTRKKLGKHYASKYQTGRRG